MKPTTYQDERIFADMHYYESHEVQRGDVVILLFPKDRSTHFLKRVVGLPGEEVGVREQKVYINGEMIEEPYVIFEGKDIDGDYGPVTMPKGNVFVLGDNRNNSYDSRHWGPVPKEDILGKVKRIYWSKDKGRI